MGRLSDLGSRRLTVDEFLAKVSAGIEPGVQRFRLAGRSLGEREYSLPGGFQAIVRNGQNGRVDCQLVLAQDLDDVAVGRRIENLEYVRSGGQHAKALEVNARNLHRTAEGEYGFPVPFGRLYI